MVVGGGEGLGAEFSRQLAARGLNVVIVALEGDVLEELARRIQSDHGVEVICVTGDVTQPEVSRRLESVTERLEIGLVVYNAGLAVRGTWLDTPIGRHMDMVDLNVRGPLVVLDRHVPGMVERGRGGVILVSSMSGLQGSPLLATYAATKAFSLNLAESLWDEWRGLGVDVTAVVPGPTDTPGYRRSAPRATRFAPRPMSAVRVASEALDSLGSRVAVFPGTQNKLAATVMSRLLPRRAASAFMGQTMRSMYRDAQSRSGEL
jgi:short-subunit dehydrogenase